MKLQIPDWLIIIAGIGQIFTAVAYPFVRKQVLYWFDDIKNLKPLNEAIAKTYGFYIQAINFVFGVFSIALVKELNTPSELSFALTTFMGLYWIGRILFQLKNYPINDLSEQRYFLIGKWGMNLMILYFAIIFTLLAISNFKIYLI